MRVLRTDRILFIAVIMSLIAVSVSLRIAVAQGIKASDTFDQHGFNLNADMQAYQIIYKEYGNEYSSYYKIIREKIIKRLKRNYTDNYDDGDIALYFVLNAKGSLARIDVDTGRSTGNKGLVSIALLSLQEASPFPPFPKELNVSQLPFTVIVSFKENSDG